MFSGVLILSFIIIFLIIGVTVLVTIKAYSVTKSETIDPLPPTRDKEDNGD